MPWVLEGALRYPGIGTERRKQLAGVSGDVVEIGFGSGLNLPYYPHGVRRVVGVEPDRRVSKLGRKRMDRAPFEVDLIGLKGEEITADSASFDHAVTTFTMCSIPGPALYTAMNQVMRVLKPGGKLHFLEHGTAPSRFTRWLQRTLPGKIWGVAVGGCNLTLDIGEVVRASGFETEVMHKYYMGWWTPRYISYFYRGVARKP
jgi:ubiquinone/menaquinone biosynthesis C-methylase UbiE